MDLKIIFAVVSFVVVNFFTCIDAQRFSASQTHSDFPGQCWDPDTETAYTVGESWNVIDHCARIQCIYREDLDLLMHSTETCQRIQLGSEYYNRGCTLVGDYEKNYPQCCETIQCPDDQ